MAEIISPDVFLRGFAIQDTPVGPNRFTSIKNRDRSLYRMIEGALDKDYLAINNVYEVANVAARDAIEKPIKGDIAIIANVGGGAKGISAYTGTAWSSIVAEGVGGGGNPTFTAIDNTTALISDDYTVVSADSSAATAQLPASPVQGDQYTVQAIDITNGVTVDRNGNNINGAALDRDLDSPYQAVIFTYYDVTQGWLVS